MNLTILKETKPECISGFVCIATSVEGERVVVLIRGGNVITNHRSRGLMYKHRAADVDVIRYIGTTNGIGSNWQISIKRVITVGRGT